MRHRDLLRALTGVEPVRVQGTFERHSSLRFEALLGSAAGGRWGARGAFAVLYLGRPRESVVIEAYRHLVDDELDEARALAATVLERRLSTCRVDVPGVLDLRPPGAQAALGLSARQLRSAVGDYGPCHAVGAGAHEFGLAGILAPAATRLGETLALYPANLPVERWPTVTARDTWHGLPPDPRGPRPLDTG